MRYSLQQEVDELDPSKSHLAELRSIRERTLLHRAAVTVKIKRSLYCGGGWKRLRAELLRMGDGEYEVTVTRKA